MELLNSRVARFFLVQHTKTGKIYQMALKIYQMAVRKDQMAKKYIGRPTSSIARPCKIYTNCDFGIVFF
jgi:hypothetical protein